MPSYFNGFSLGDWFFILVMIAITLGDTVCHVLSEKLLRVFHLTVEQFRCSYSYSHCTKEGTET